MSDVRQATNWVSRNARTIVISACIILATILFFTFSAPHEPTCEGRTLSSWLADLDHPAFAPVSPEVRAAAESALRSLGPEKAMPTLVWMLRRSKGPFRSKIEKWIAKQSVLKIDFGPSIERIHWRAITAVRVLGARAKAVIPPLIELLQNPAQLTRSAALGALGNFAAESPDVLSHIVKAVEDPNPYVRLAAWGTLGSVGPGASESLPTLMEKARDSDDETRAIALRSLCAISQNSTNLLSLLSDSLGDKSVTVRGAAVFLLGQYGERARPTAPLIEKLRQDPDRDIRRTATKTLEAVSGAVQSGKQPSSVGDFRLLNVPATQVLQIYATMVGKTLDIPPDVNRVIQGLSISVQSFGVTDANDPPKLIEQALLGQARISLKVAADGKLAVRYAIPAKAEERSNQPRKP